MKIDEQETLRLPILVREFKRPGVLSSKSAQHYKALAFYGRWLALLFVLGSIMAVLTLCTWLNPNFHNPLVAPTPTQVPCAHALVMQQGQTITTIQEIGCQPTP